MTKHNIQTELPLDEFANFTLASTTRSTRADMAMPQSSDTTHDEMACYVHTGKDRWVSASEMVSGKAIEFMLTGRSF